MIESLEQLRNEIQILSGNNIDTDELAMIADAIEREVDERYIERPVDADGTTISPSDNMVDSNGEQLLVSSIELLASGEWLVYGNGKLGSVYAKLCHHYKPPTVEDILMAFADHVYNEAMKFERVSDEAIAEYAAKLELREEAE